MTRLHLIRNPNLYVLCYFYKLRTQALASLHSGLQNSQGLPVAHVANWLAMEVYFLDRCVCALSHFFPFTCVSGVWVLRACGRHMGLLC